MSLTSKAHELNFKMQLFGGVLATDHIPITK